MRSIVGLFAGTAVMGLMFSFAFANWRALLPVIGALFLLNSLGYFGGGWIEGHLAPLKQFHLVGLTLSGRALGIFMKLAWGACFGLGLGAGLACALYLCQAQARVLLRNMGSR